MDLESNYEIALTADFIYSRNIYPQLQQKLLERLQKFSVFILWLVAEKLKERKIES